MEIQHLCYGNPDCYGGCKYQSKPIARKGLIQAIIRFFKRV